jgi:hypothetical protein
MFKSDTVVYLVSNRVSKQRRQMLTIKRAPQWVGRGEETSATNGNSEVWAHVQSFRETLEQNGNGISFSVVRDEVVVCKGIEAGAR